MGRRCLSIGLSLVLALNVIAGTMPAYAFGAEYDADDPAILELLNEQANNEELVSTAPDASVPEDDQGGQGDGGTNEELAAQTGDGSEASEAEAPARDAGVEAQSALAPAEDTEPEPEPGDEENSEPAPPEDTATITGVRFYFMVEDTPATDDTPATYRREYYDPNADPPVIPGIGEAQGEVQLGVILRYSDDTEKEPAEADVTLQWHLARFLDTQDIPTMTALASVDATGMVKALQAGNGAAVLTCTIDDVTFEDDQEIKVLIAGNEVPPPTITGFELLYRDPTVAGDDYTVEGTGDNYAAISTKGGQLQLAVQLVMSDGSRMSAHAAGLDFAWSILGGGPLAALDTATCLLTGNGMGNGTVTLLCSPPANLQGGGFASQTMDVQILNNEFEETPAYQPIELYLLYTDYRNENPQSYNEYYGQYPLIFEKEGSCLLVPRVLMSPTGDAHPGDHGWNVSWSIVATTTFDNEPLEEQIATVASDGTVTANGTGNGIVTVRAWLLEYPEIPAQEVRVRIDQQTGTYLRSLTIVDQDGNPYPGASMTLDAPNKLVEAYVIALYSDGTQKQTWMGETIEGLKWTVSDSEQAAIEENTGMFVGKQGFTQFWVKAEVPAAGLLGTSVTDYLYVQSTDNSEDLDLHSDTLQLRVYFDSDYVANRNDAKVVVEKTITVDEVIARLNPYTTQYTYSRWDDETNKPGRWGTMAAYGVSFNAIATEMGINVQDLTGMKFNMRNSINDSPVSATMLFTTRYYYPQFKNGAESGVPSTAGAQVVAPMLALSTSRADYESGASTANMVISGRFRLCVGMYSVRDSNDRNSYKWVYGIDLIVKDEAVVLDPEQQENPDDFKEPPQKGPGGEGNDFGGVGTIGGDGGGTGGASGEATAGQKGGDGGDTLDTSDATGAEAGGGGTSVKPTYSIHQILSDSQTWFNQPDEPNPFIPMGTTMAVGALAAGALKAMLVFAGQRRTRKQEKAGP
jgi:hypothetical protein